MSILSDFKTKFRVSELEIFSVGSWTWSVRPVQATVGAGILSLNYEASQLSQISEEDGKDFARIVNIIEKSLLATFSYEKVNYLMLMMVDSQVHYHVIPRYSDGRTFAGSDWTDPGWPKPPIMDAEPVSDDILLSIRASLRAACPMTS